MNTSNTTTIYSTHCSSIELSHKDCGTSPKVICSVHVKCNENDEGAASSRRSERSLPQLHRNAHHDTKHNGKTPNKATSYNSCRDLSRGLEVYTTRRRVCTSLFYYNKSSDVETWTAYGERCLSGRFC